MEVLTMLGAQGCPALCQVYLGLPAHPWPRRHSGANGVEGVCHSRSHSASYRLMPSFRAPAGRRNRWSRPDVSQKIWSWGSVGIRGFAFKFHVLETLSVLSNAPDRQNLTQGSSVKTLKSVSLQEACALFIHRGHLEVTCRLCLSFWGWSELKSECSAQCAWVSVSLEQLPTRGTELRGAS